MLHDYQTRAVAEALSVLDAGQKALFVSPTGSGKSYMEAEVHDLLWGSGLLTVAPTLEVLVGIYRRLAGRNDSILLSTPDGQRSECERHGLWTVMRLHNALMSGVIPPPTMLQFDEGHHTTACTYETLHALCGDCPAVTWTATGFRGTPEETKKLRAKWGEPRIVLTLKQAVARGVVSRPDMIVWPLLNDETIKVTAGEFETKAVESALKECAEELVTRIAARLTNPFPIRPTMVTAPGVASARHLTQLLRQAGVPVVCITGEGVDGADSRQEGFTRVTNREALLVQVNVVGEGVDLPIRVQVDTAPTMSPVRWMQRVGRGTRPTEQTPLYICTNHNIARHSYLWAGVLPPDQVRAAQKAWGPEFKPSRRLLARAIGLEGFGRFTVSQVPLSDGTLLSLYALQTPNGTHQYAVLLHPCMADPLFFVRENPYTGELAELTLPSGQTVLYKTKDWGRWTRTTEVPALDGYVSTKPGLVTPKMQDWWVRSGERLGLDPTYRPNAREFQVLPILSDTRTRFTC